METMRYVVLLVLVGCGSAGDGQLGGDGGGADLLMVGSAFDLAASSDLASGENADLADPAGDLAHAPGPDMAACGMWKQPCCNGVCTESGTVCYPYGPPDGNTASCFLCGNQGQLCCAGNTCANSLLKCQPPGSGNAGLCE